MRSFIPVFAILLAGCSEPSPPADKAPPPISGGTLVISASGRHAVAADPDRDRVWIVDIEKPKVIHEIVLESGDEPGRLAEDGAGRVHVALRRGGALVGIDMASGKIVGRHPVCAAPRGVAYEAATDAMHVACLGGDLVSLRASDGAELRRLPLERDLRDVVVTPEGLTVSLFRSAELVYVDTMGTVTERSLLPFAIEDRFAPAVAWRMRPLPSGGVLVAHQSAFTSAVHLPPPGSTGESSYGSSGGHADDPGIVHSVVTVVRPGDESPDAPERPSGPLVPLATLPVDAAVSHDGNMIALVAAGAGTVITFPVASLAEPTLDVTRTPVFGQPIAVAYDALDRVWVQTRRPARLTLLGGPAIALGEEPAAHGATDAAHDLFHLTTGTLGSMACASCHPEGSDDGRVWNFVEHDSGDFVYRRTQSLRGGVTMGPYHWDGALPDFDALVEDVMVGRMGGSPPGAGRITALADWLIGMPAFPNAPSASPSAAARGEALFVSTEVGCATCHLGDKLTNDETVSVGTGDPLQVPTLVGIAHHAPFMHNGCAPTLLDRFGSCGGGDAHGHTSQLSEAELSDLVAYLETL